VWGSGVGDSHVEFLCLTLTKEYFHVSKFFSFCCGTPHDFDEQCPALCTRPDGGNTWRWSCWSKPASVRWHWYHAMCMAIGVTAVMKTKPPTSCRFGSACA
jgi:hypothetical protein